MSTKRDISPDFAEEIVSNLVSFLKDESPEVRCQAAQALSHLEKWPKESVPEKAMAALYGLLTDSQSTVKRAVVKTLYKLKWENLPPEVVQELFKRWIQPLGDKTAARLLSLQASLSEEIIHNLNELKNSNDEMVRLAANIALQKTISKPSPSPIQAA